MVVTPYGGDLTQTMMDSARVGLDYIVENSDYIEKLALALESKNFTVKKQVFELLSALCVYSSDGYNRTIEALEHFKKNQRERYRFKFIVNELQCGPTLEYQTAVIAFINCLILATSDLQERIRIRSHFLGLKLAQVLNDLRHKRKDCSDLSVQIDVFDEQRESDESQLATNLPNIDLASPLEVFDAILRQIADTPQEIPFLSILQHLLRIDFKDPVSDIIWDTTERLVHRATLLESHDDAARLLSQHHQSRSALNKVKAGDRCSCTCHKDRRASVATGEDSLPQLRENVCSPPAPAPPPPPPPAPPIPGQGLIPPPPAPPPMSLARDKSPKSASSFEALEKVPRLPQQTIPAPKTKMRTVNWNKIPMGQILNSDKDNLWSNFAKNYQNSASAMDWDALEGLFCIPSEKPGGNLNIVTGQRQNTTEKPKKESQEILLLDAKRSLNINIFLKQFRSSNKDIVKHIMDANSEEIGSERLRGLLKILPSKDEVEMLKAVPELDKSRLGSAERFLLELIEVKAYRLRIEAMLLREDLDACFHSLDSSINVILQATQEIKNAKHFQDVLFMILVAGNFLNSGGYAGDAVGVKLSSLQKIGDIRGNQPGISLLNFISMQAEAKNPDLLNFANDMVSLEEASKTSIDQIKTEMLALKKKVELICEQMEKSDTPWELNNQLGQGFREAKLQIKELESELKDVENARVDLAQFFYNKRRKQQEEEARQRKKIREEQFQKRLQLGWETPQSVEHFNNSQNKSLGIGLSPEDEIFIACSPRVVRRRLGSNTDAASSGGTTPDQLIPPSPDGMKSTYLTMGTRDITPNGSLRRRRSRAPSDEDESGLMDYLRVSGQDGARERKGPEQYGSLDRSWSRKTRRRPNLMEFVNDDRERPVSPALQDAASPTQAEHSNRDVRNDNPAREWRERIDTWFVDLENGRGGDNPPRRPPPRRFQRRLNLDSLDPSSRGLATLPEGETGQEDTMLPSVSPYQRVYSDRRPSVKLHTDVVGAMEAIEEVQSPTKDRPQSKKLFERTASRDSMDSQSNIKKNRDMGGRRSLIGSLGASENGNEKLVLYIKDDALPKRRPDESVSKKTPSTASVRDRKGESKSSNGALSNDHGESFDRFSSLRKSLRYKKEPDSPSPLMRSGSLYSNVRSRPKAEDNIRLSKPSSFTGKDDLKVSIRQGRSNEIAKYSEELRSNRVHSPTVINTGHGTSIVQIKSPTRETSKSYGSSKTYLSSSPGTAERDEGFEESHSSLSETNSQSESHNNTTTLFSAKVQERKPIQRINGSFRIKSKETPSHREMTNHVNNNFNTLASKNSSKGSLQSSRSSLNSQSTVATVKENPSSKRSTHSNSRLSESMRVVGTPSNSLLSSSPSFFGADLSRVAQKNMRNGSTHSSSPMITLAPDTKKSNSKGLTLAPRLLSFMRPTASSTAKDKADAAKNKSKSGRGSFR